MDTNSTKVTIAIGPVQGCLAPLRSLIDRCRRYAAEQGSWRPRYVLLGNLIGHGPDSAGVIEFFRRFELEQDVVMLRGAQEQMMIDTILGADDGVKWAHSGGADTIASYGLPRFDDPELPSNERIRSIIKHVRSDPHLIKDARWLSGLPLTYEDDHRVFVHDQRQGVPLIGSDLERLARCDPIRSYEEPLGKLIVHGSHTPHRSRQPEVRPNLISLDTNAWWSGVLVAGVFNQTQAIPIIVLSKEFDLPEIPFLMG